MKMKPLVRAPIVVIMIFQVAALLARAYLEIKETEGFATYLWGFVDGVPKQTLWKRLSEVPAQTEQSHAMSKDLKSRGFKFCGPTICYAFMQAVGMVNDHTTDCFRYKDLSEKQVRKLAKR